jgi:DNA-binding Lrp family transcriptional regulator
MSWWSGHKILDPTELEARFSTEDGMAFMDALVSEEMTDESHALLDRVKAVMDQIPPREADFIELYYFRRIKQTSIAAIFGVSQPTVCYRLQRAAARIRFLLMLPDVDQAELETAAKAVLDDPVDVQILLLMLATTCQSEVAKRLNVSQGFVRHRFIRSIEKLRRAGGYEAYVALFELIATNLNILREVQRPPVWGSKVAYVVV